MTSKNKIDANTKVYDWWKTMCSGDKNCYKMSDVKNKTITFGEVLESMKKKDIVNHKDFYTIVGVDWSEVRCEIFDKMCEIFDFNYKTIFGLWIGGMDGIKEDVEKYRKLAKYRGKDMKKFEDKILNVAGFMVDGFEGVESLKQYFAKLVDDYNRLCA